MSGDVLQLRRWPGIRPEALLVLLHDAVRGLASARYDGEQIEAWLDSLPDGAGWRARLQRSAVTLAERGGELAGFVSLAPPGVVDLLFVHPDHARRGVGRALLSAAIEQAADRPWPQLEADVSLVARPLFETLGFRVLRRQMVERGSRRLDNFRMRLAPLASRRH